MAKYDTSIFNKRLERIAAELQSTIRGINKNDDLSNAGKSRAIERAREESRSASAKLREDFQTDVGNRREIMSRKKETKPSPRELLRRRAVDEGETYPSTYGDDVRANLLIEAMENLGSKLDNFLETQALSQRDEKWFRSQLELGLKNKDVAKLSQLSRVLPLLPNGETSERLSAQFEAALSSLKEEMLTPQERAVKAEIEELDREAALFEYSLANFEQRGEYVDPRTPTPENETVLRPANPNPRLGVSSTSDKFARYKGGSEPVES